MRLHVELRQVMDRDKIDCMLQARDEPGGIALAKRQQPRTIQSDEQRVRLIPLLGQTDRQLLVHSPLLKVAELSEAPGHIRQRDDPIRSGRLDGTLSELFLVQRRNRLEKLVRRATILAEAEAREGNPDV